MYNNLQFHEKFKKNLFYKCKQDLQYLGRLAINAAWHQAMLTLYK